MNPLSASAAFVREVGATLLLLWRGLIRRGPRNSLARQTYDLLLLTVPLNVASMACVGAVAIVDAGNQIARIFGDPAGIGPAVLQLILREFGPAVGGVIAATRIGSGIAAEIAAMKVSEQIDAMELCSVDPIAELISPRVRASIIALLGLGAVSVVSAVYTSAFAAYWTFGSRPGAFLDTSLLVPADFAVAGVKLLAFGLAIPAFAARAGLTATGGAPAVGRATTRGVVASIVSVVVLDLVIGGAALAMGV